MERRRRKVYHGCPVCILKVCDCSAFVKRAQRLFHRRTGTSHSRRSEGTRRGQGNRTREAAETKPQAEAAEERENRKERRRLRKARQTNKTSRIIFSEGGWLPPQRLRKAASGLHDVCKDVMECYLL